MVDPATMSSTITKRAAAQAQATAPKASSAATQNTAAPTTAAQLQPVQTKQTPLAQTARFALPALLAGLFLVRFRALVADPVSEMSIALPMTAALQAGYAIVCLPVAGSQNAKPARKPRPGEKKRPGAGESGGPSAVAVCLYSSPRFPSSHCT